MLIIAESLSRIRFSELMLIYQESNMHAAELNYPNYDPYRQEAAACEDFYQFLKQVFFTQPGAYYALWQTDGCYRAAVRVEPFADGLLLSGLETAPNDRRKGYASALLLALLRYIFMHGNGVIYSHVEKSNIASFAIHKKCGFQISSHSARFLDGSASQRYYTMKLIYVKAESK